MTYINIRLHFSFPNKRQLQWSSEHTEILILANSFYIFSNLVASETVFRKHILQSVPRETETSINHHQNANVSAIKNRWTEKKRKKQQRCTNSKQNIWKIMRNEKQTFWFLVACVCIRVEKKCAWTTASSNARRPEGLLQAAAEQVHGNDGRSTWNQQVIANATTNCS